MRLQFVCQSVTDIDQLVFSSIANFDILTFWHLVFLCLVLEIIPAQK